MVEAKVTMVLMQNQDPADFANRIGSKVEVQTKNPSATAEKETTSLSDLNQKNPSTWKTDGSEDENADSPATAEDEKLDSPATAKDQNKIPSNPDRLQMQLKANDEGLINHWNS